MTAGPQERQRWVVVRSVGPVPEEEGVLSALAAEAVREGAELVTVLLGTAAYEVEQLPLEGRPRFGTVWVLEEEYRGRGIRPAAEHRVRRLSPDELVEELMSAQKVISFS